MITCSESNGNHQLNHFFRYSDIYLYMNSSYSYVIKGSLDEKLPIYEQDPKSKRLDSFEKRFVGD